MERRNSLLKWVAAPIIIFLILLAYGFEAFSTKDPSEKSIERRADMVVIDTLKSFGPLERTAVAFLHDLHTEALAKENQECQTCHLPGKADTDRFPLKFKRQTDISKRAVMDIYHGECIGCHKERTAAGKKAGPMETCNDCHPREAGVISIRLPMAFDKSLHFRHTKANNDPKTNKGDCAVCHHEYDPAVGKLVYVKDREGSCRYCHKKETRENRISMRLASHMDCINCHLRKIAAKTDAGPVMCKGCHDQKFRQEMTVLENIPRMERKQPDIVLVQLSQAEGKKTEGNRMNPVPFNHKAHESANRTCIVCHHESLQPCSQCHTPTGAKEGNFVNLEKAMHLAGSNQSCIGCHEANQLKPQCAACHSAVSPKHTADLSSCRACHVASENNPLKAAAVNDRPLAETLYQMGKKRPISYRDDEIPEKVTIGLLSERYAPVELPHRKVVRKLLNNIQDDKLANFFHREKGVVCRGCHHNSPADMKPPRCAGCHDQPLDRRNASSPGLKGAYHQQCLGCHHILKLTKPAATACADCHKEKQGVRIAG